MESFIASLLNSTAEEVPLRLVSSALDSISEQSNQIQCAPCLDDNGSTLHGLVYGIVGAALNWLLHGGWQFRKWWLCRNVGLF